MVWKWEVWLCRNQPQWSRPQGIQMVSTWTPLTAQLEGEEGEKETERSSGLNRKQVCTYIHQCPINVQFIHIHEKLEKWCTLAKPLSVEKLGGKSETQFSNLDHWLMDHSLLTWKFKHILQMILACWLYLCYCLFIMFGYLIFSMFGLIHSLFHISFDWDLLDV